MNQNINVDLIPKFAVYGNLYFSQYDVGREAIINLVNGSTEYEIPSGATVTLAATKPSGLGFTQNCTFEGNQITVVCTAEMTDEAGRFPCELRIVQGSTILGTANFTFNVERSPHPEGTTDGTAESVLNDITVAYNHAMDQIENAGGLTVAIKNALLNCFQKVAWIDEHGQDYYDALADELFAVTGITLNSSTLLFSSLGSTQQLTASLIPSTSTATVSWASSDTSVATVSSSGLVTSVANGSATITASVGSVSATCSVSVAVATVTSISAVLNASGHTFYVGDPVDDIKPYLTVTATYSDSSTTTVPSGSYTLSGTLSQVGANTITVSYESVTTTVSVTCAAAELSYISAVYTQSGTVYDTDTLDSLKSDLVVTAHYSDSTTSTVASADYTLSGTLAVGTSTVTVTYEGMTATFNVTVTEDNRVYNMNYLFSDITLSDGYIGDDGNVVSLANNVFWDEMIKAKGFWLAGSNGVYYNDNHVYLRIAEYDSNEDFIGRKAVQQGSAVKGNPAVADSGEFIKMGTNSYTDYVTQNADRFVACNILDTSICTIANKTIDSNGDVQDASASSVSDYLPINSGYMICQLTTVGDSALVVFYDSNHELISRNAVTTALTNYQLFIEVPSNAAYVRFRCENSPRGDTYVSYAI